MWVYNVYKFENIYELGLGFRGFVLGGMVYIIDCIRVKYVLIWFCTFSWFLREFYWFMLKVWIYIKFWIELKGGWMFYKCVIGKRDFFF